MKTIIYMIELQDEVNEQIWRDLEQTTEAHKEIDLDDWQKKRPHRKFRLVRVTTTREVIKG